MEPYFVLSISSSAAYVSRFSVTYNDGGKSQTANSGTFGAGTQKSVNIPSTATDLYLKAEAEVFVDTWSDIFTQQWVSAPESPVCYQVSGETLNRHWQAVSC